MAVDPAAVGVTRSVVQEVSARWVLGYSASLGLVGDEFLDDTRPGGPVVPPSFCVCLEWALAGGEARAQALGLSPAERERIVHAFQDSRFEAPFRVGMQVETVSRFEEIRATRAGALVLTRFTHRDVTTGMMLATSLSGSMVRGVPVEGVEATGSGKSAAKIDKPGAAAHEHVLQLGRGLTHVYSEGARIWNPIHTERAVALRAGLPDTIVHGTITWALAGLAALREVPGAGVLDIARLAGSFRAPVLTGTPITVRAERAADGGSVRFEVVNAGSQAAINDGVVEFKGFS